MRLITLLLLTVSCVFCKNSVKSLTESMGQEVIEIGAPLKELPPDFEEEPSAENDDNEVSTTAQVVTIKKEPRTTTAELVVTEKKDKDINKIDGVTLDDEEARIEKELAEIYKDNIEDYKADSSEKELNASNTKTEAVNFNKSIGRSKDNFKFQPNNMRNENAIEKFRTSIDEISCRRKLAADQSTTPASLLHTTTDSACSVFASLAFVLISVSTALFTF